MDATTQTTPYVIKESLCLWCSQPTKNDAEYHRGCFKEKAIQVQDVESELLEDFSVTDPPTDFQTQREPTETKKERKEWHELMKQEDELYCAELAITEAAEELEKKRKEMVGTVQRRTPISYEELEGPTDEEHKTCLVFDKLFKRVDVPRRNLPVGEEEKTESIFRYLNTCVDTKMWAKMTVEFPDTTLIHLPIVNMNWPCIYSEYDHSFFHNDCVGKPDSVNVRCMISIKEVDDWILTQFIDHNTWYFFCARCDHPIIPQLEYDLRRTKFHNDYTMKLIKVLCNDEEDQMHKVGVCDRSYKNQVCWWKFVRPKHFY